MRTARILILIILGHTLFYQAVYAQNQWTRTHTFRTMRICMLDADTLFLYGDLGTITKSTDGGDTWQYRNYPMASEDIKDMCFPDPVNGYFLAKNFCNPSCQSRLLKTTNGGCDWTPVNMPVLNAGETINGITFSDVNTGWAATSTGKIYKTTDGSNSWTIQYQLGSVLATVKCLNSQFVVAAGASGRVISSHDGGNTWIPSTTPLINPLQRIHIIDNNTIYIAGGAIFKSTDGGTSWQTNLTLRGTGSPFFVDVCFRDNTYGIALATNAVSYKTMDAGITWTQLPDEGVTKFSNSNLDQTNTLEMIGIKGSSEFITGRNGVLKNKPGPNSYWKLISSSPYGSIINQLRYSRDGSVAHRDGRLSGMMYKSEDDGRYWNRVNMDDPGTSLIDIAMDNTGKGIAVGNFCSIYQTQDGGATWGRQLNDLPLSNRREDLFDVQLRPSGYAWAVGGSGIILHSTDAGVHWKKQVSPSPNVIYKVSFVDDNLGWASSTPSLYKTVNGGNTWTTIYTGATNRYHPDVFFLNANDGWMISAHRFSTDTTFLLKTSDGGTNWTRKKVIDYSLSIWTFAQLIGIDVIDDNELRTYTQDTIYHSTDGGNSWSATRFTGGPIKKLKFRDHSEGYLLSGNSIYYTNNAGASWSVCELKDKVAFNGIDTKPGAVYLSGTNTSICINTANPLNEQDWVFQVQPREFGDGNGTFYFLDRQYGWKHHMVYKDIAFTSNGGRSWKVQAIIGDTSVTDLHFTSRTIGYACNGYATLSGNHGLYSKTLDGGKTWQFFNTGIPGETPNSISFYDDNHGFFGGNKGLIITTHDGLQTKLISHLPSSEDIRKIFRTGPLSGWVLTASRMYHTQNDGQAWTPRPLPVSGVLADASFINDSTGMVLVLQGNIGTTYFTTDFGLTWRADQISPFFEETTYIAMNQSKQAIAIPYGVAPGSYYGTFIFSVPVDSLKVKFTVDTLDFCGREIRLNATSNLSGTQFNWVINGTTVTDNPITITQPAGSDSLKIALYGTIIQSLQCNKAAALTDSSKQLVVFDSIPVAAFKYDSACNNSRLRFTNLSTSVNPVTRYSWNFGDGDTSNLFHPEHVYAGAGSHTISLVAYSRNGCASSPFERQVLTGDLPKLTISRSNDIDCSNPSSVLSAPPGFSSYEWFPPSALSNPFLQNPVATPSTTEVYHATLTDNTGCEWTTDTVTVFVKGSGSTRLFVPTGFTPNNDGKNDCIGVKGSGLYSKFLFRIYNRWGELVFQTTTPGACWNGYHRGVLQSTANFVYYLQTESECGVVFKKGNIVLIR